MRRMNIKKVRALLRTIATGSAAFATLTMINNTAQAADATAGLPGDWLSRYASARSIGMGGAFTAVANDPLGVVWNPAGLTQLLQNEARFETAQYFEDTSINGFSFVVPARKLPTIGITMLSLGSDGFERTNELNESLGTFKQSDMAFLISGAKAVTPRLSLGANIKVVRQEVESFTSTGVGGDVGGLFSVTPRVKVGLSFLNLGGPSLAPREVKETFPMEVRGGVAVGYLNGRGLLSLEADHRDGPGTTLHAGTEIWFQEQFGLRAGYFDTEPAGGFSYRVNPAIQFDYGMNDHELGLVHYVALSYKFGGFFANSYAAPEVFSPIGENSVTQFNIKSRTKAETKQWQLDVVDKHNQIVRTFGGLGVPPAHVMWDGKDENGMTLPDGYYTYKLVVTDDEGRVLRAEDRKVQITTAGPQGGVPVIVE
jgi:hypothetical protein